MRRKSSIDRDLLSRIYTLQVDGSFMKPFMVKPLLQTEHTRSCTSAYSRIMTVISETGTRCHDKFSKLI